MANTTDELHTAQACAGTVAAPACRGELGWGLMTMASTFKQWAAEAVADLPGGLRGHFVLTSIADSQVPSQASLAAQLGLDRTVMTYLVDELEQAGFVERRPDPADRRARLLSLTKAGRTALTEYRTRIDAAEARLLADLDADEAGRFRAAIERVARASKLAAEAGPGTC